MTGKWPPDPQDLLVVGPGGRLYRGHVPVDAPSAEQVREENRREQERQAQPPGTGHNRPPEPTPAEIITPTRFADVMAAVGEIQKGNSTAISRALEMLSRCADADPFKVQDVFTECKDRGGYPIGAIKAMYALFEARNTPTSEGENNPSSSWRSELIFRDNGEPYGNLANVCAALRGNPDFLQPDGSSVFALNEFTNFPMLQGVACWEPITTEKQIGFGRPVTDDDHSRDHGTNSAAGNPGERKRRVVGRHACCHRQEISSRARVPTRLQIELE
jgi:hypothetical protein